MNFLDKFRYSFDNLNELSVTKNRSTETKANYNDSGNSSQNQPENNEMDQRYLSRWEIKKTCDGGKVDSWVEWIEPLILQSRHPFAYRRCRHSSPIYWNIKHAYASFPSSCVGMIMHSSSRLDGSVPRTCTLHNKQKLYVELENGINEIQIFR